MYVEQISHGRPTAIRARPHMVHGGYFRMHAAFYDAIIYFILRNWKEKSFM